MRIVNIIQRYPPAVGGSETWGYEVCRYLARQGHDVTVLTLAVNKEEEFWREPLDSERNLAFGRLAVDGGVKVRRFRRSLPVHSLYHLVFRKLLHETFNVYFYGPHSVALYGRLWREIRGADVVFLHTVPYPHNWVAFCLARALGRKTLIVPHFHPKHPHYESPSVYWLLRHCDGVVTVSPFESDYLAGKGVRPARLHVTGNAIHPGHYAREGDEAFWERVRHDYGIEDHEKVVLFVGRKTPEKGVGHLVEAVEGLLDRLPLRLLLCGPGFDWFAERCRQLGPEARRRIIDLGVVPEPAKLALLRHAHLLALPSRYEAFGIVFLEAWMCGVPVLGTSEGAMPSVIGEEGLLCRYGDVADIRAKLLAAFEDESARRAMGQRGRAKVLARYTWEKIGRKAEDALRAVCGRRKLLLCTNAYPPRFIGGAELVAHAQARWLQTMGWEVAVFAGDLRPRRRRYRLRKTRFEGLDVWRLVLHPADYGTDRFSFFHAEAEQAFARVLDAFAPDVIHFHNISGLSLGLIPMARRRGIRTVVTLHDYWGLCLRNTLTKADGQLCAYPRECGACQPYFSDARWQDVPARLRLDYLALRLGAVPTAVSPSTYLAERYRETGLVGGDVEVIPNGIDLARFTGISRGPGADRLRVGYIGHLGRHKGVPVLLEALQHLDPARFFLHIVGEGDLGPELKARVQAMGWNQAVRFWDRIANSGIAKVYGAIDVLVLPSVWPENHPVSINEAMAAGLPVVASRIGGIPELVADGVTGYLFEPGDARDLAAKLGRLEADRGLLQAMGQAARSHIQALDLRHQVAQIDALYRRTDAGLADRPFPVVVAVAGRRLGGPCTEVLERLQEAGEAVRFVLLDWLQAEEIASCRLCWAADAGLGLADLEPALCNGLPLVVPAAAGLAEACRTGDCGLVYRDAVEAAVCLEHLLAHPATARRMGANALRLFYAHGPAV